jgi:NAD(P)-dependent dehydrogenase (short-subunit alcohol dehydrogenase family)
MKEVCVISGGGSGMGLASAKEMGMTHYVIICGRTVQKLENAIVELRTKGIECEAYPCDVSNHAQVHSLALYAKEKGPVQAVIHAAGISPRMGDAQQLIETNALGTIHINTEFASVMGKDSCILDVSSMAAYIAPDQLMPKEVYELSLTDEKMFFEKMLATVNKFPEEKRTGLAYSLSKNFVIWYAKKNAHSYGDKGIRVVSVSPGHFDTPMGNLEGKRALLYIDYAAIKREGKPEEIAYLFSTIVNKRNSYLTGVDILCDGGSVEGYQKMQKLQKPV